MQSGLGTAYAEERDALRPAVDVGAGSDTDSVAQAIVDESSMDSFEAQFVAGVEMAPATAPAVEEPDNEFVRWKSIGQSLNWVNIIQSQQVAQFRLDVRRLGSPYYLCTVVDSLKAWKDLLVAQFPVLHRIAIRVLPTPDANGFQERCFSSASTINTVLRQSLLSDTFEMKTLLKVNAEWIKRMENQGGAPVAERAVVDLALE
jgi:hypothetical protein